MTILTWKTGTGYDFFISLMVLHHAAEFGLRPAWAAGVRQRLTGGRREFLERFQSYAVVPIQWITSLPEPRDAETVLDALARMPAGERWTAAALPDGLPAEVMQTLAEIRRHGRWKAADQELIGRNLARRNKFLKASGLENLLDDWVHAERTGEELQTALQEYYQAFFTEEEARLRPALQAGLTGAREKAVNKTIEELVEELSGGVRFEEMDAVEEVTLVPSYWSSPFIFTNRPGSPHSVIVFGCRPRVESVVPGAQAPDMLVNALKALADPTRLQILRHLSAQAQSPSELARRLQLRPPTIIHHLQSLRLAGLVTIHISEDGERRYAARLENLHGIFTSVAEYIREHE